MNLHSSLNRSGAMPGKLALALAAVCLVSTAALAAGPNDGVKPSNSVVQSSPRNVGTVGPLVNTTVGNARYLLPDGSNVYDYWGTDAEHWYYTEIEPGKTYVLEAMDPYSDAGLGSTDGMGVYDSDGTTTPPPETNVDCTGTLIAPGLRNFANRCIVRPYAPWSNTTLGKRAIYFKIVHFGSNNSMQVRVRESTIYGRWTTNAYDFHVEAQNTGATSVCVQVLLLPNGGLSYPYYFTSMTIPAYGANKVVVPANTTSGTEAAPNNKRGTLRIIDCGGGDFNSGTLHVSTYAFNPNTNQYLYFFPWTVNQGNGSSF